MRHLICLLDRILSGFFVESLSRPSDQETALVRAVYAADDATWGRGLPMEARLVVLEAANYAGRGTLLGVRSETPHPDMLTNVYALYTRLLYGIEVLLERSSASQAEFATGDCTEAGGGGSGGGGGGAATGSGTGTSNGSGLQRLYRLLSDRVLRPSALRLCELLGRNDAEQSWGVVPDMVGVLQVCVTVIAAFFFFFFFFVAFHVPGIRATRLLAH